MTDAAPMRNNWSGSGPTSSGLTRDQAAAALEVVDNLIGDLCCCELHKAGEGRPVPGEKEMTELLMVEWGNGSKKAARKANRLLNAGNSKLSKQEIKQLVSVIDESLQAGFVANVGASLPGLIRRGYRRAKQEVVDRMVWREIDRKATGWLNDHHMFWIGDYYNRMLSEQVAQTIRAGMKEGLGREAIGRDLAEFFEDYPGVPSKPAVYWRGLAANGMNRSRQFGLVQGYVETGTRYLEIVAVLDERTSPVCRELSGKVIPLSAAVAQRDLLMAAEDPEDVKTIAPWVSAASIKGLGIRDIIDQGVVLPPYHFHCRTTVVER